MQHHSIAFQALPARPHHLRDPFVEWVTERDVAHKSTFEEREWPNSFGSVDDLVWNDKVSWLDGFLQAANSREGNDGSNSN